MDDAGIFPNLNVTQGWEKVPASAAPSAEDFLNTFNGVLWAPESTGSQGILGCTRHQRVSECGPWQDNQGMISDLRALAQPWGWFAAPLHSQGLHSRQNQLLLTGTKRRVPVWERNRQWDSQNSLGFYLLNPLCFNPLPSKWFYFYLKMHLAKVKITGVSQALLEPLRIAFTFVYFLNLK